jgi:acyl-CoA thioesterase-1
MQWLLYHIASGQAFFTGAALVALGSLLSSRESKLAKRCGLLAIVLGVIAAAISSTPVPWFIGALFALAAIAWPLILIRWKPQRKWLAAAPLMLACLVAAAYEAAHQLPRRLSPASRREVAIIGDSLTAGMGARETKERWPQILARQRDLGVRDLSHAGDTTAKALAALNKAPPIEAPLVIVEIGGNDVLGSTTVGQFALDLERLLSHLRADDRQIVMFELPLPPGYVGYGYVQRRLAKKHGAMLIPKRYLMAVLADPAATVDTIHLTTAGHQQMAELAWKRIETAFPAARDFATGEGTFSGD